MRLTAPTSPISPPQRVFWRQPARQSRRSRRLPVWPGPGGPVLARAPLTPDRLRRPRRERPPPQGPGPAGEPAANGTAEPAGTGRAEGAGKASKAAKGKAAESAGKTTEEAAPKAPSRPSTPRKKSAPPVEQADQAVV